MIRRFTTVGSVVLCAAALANPALAQRRPAGRGNRPASSASPAPAASAAPAPPVDPSVAEARREYDAGRQAMEAHQYDEALRHFQRAHELRSNPVVLIPIAQAQTQLNHFGQAIATYERYLHDRADAPDRAQIEAQITELRGRQPTLHITSTPAGGHISVDGTDTTQVTPADVRVDPGHHAVRVELAGYVASSRELDATVGGRSDVALALAAEHPTNNVATTTTTTTTATTTTAATTTTTTAPATTTVRGPHPAVWVATGLAAAGIITGTVFGILALNEHADFEQNPTAEARDRGETDALIADISFGVGILAAAVGVVVWLSTPEETPRAHAMHRTTPRGPRVIPAFNGLVVSF